MRRYIEAVFRLKFRLLIGAMLVFGVVWGALYLSKQGYGASATVWVEQPIYFANITPNWNQYITPAENQANILQELLHTRQFAIAVVRGAGIPTETEAAENRALDELAKGMRIEAQGTHLITVSYTSASPTYCKPLVEQLIKLFTDQINENRAQQAEVALDLYMKQKATYEEQMRKSQDELAKYMQANPGTLSEATAPNPQLLELQQQYDADRARYNDVVAKIERVSIDSVAAAKLSEQFFRQIDAPADPEPNRLTGKQLITNTAIGLVMGVIVAVGLALLGAWTDGAIYSGHEVVGLAPMADDGTMPELLVTGLPFVKALGARRRAALKAAKAARKAKNAADPLSEQVATSGEAAGLSLTAPLQPPFAVSANRMFEGLTPRRGVALVPTKPSIAVSERASTERLVSERPSTERLVSERPSTEHPGSERSLGERPAVVPPLARRLPRHASSGSTEVSA